jgi:hypothetical protein
MLIFLVNILQFLYEDTPIHQLLPHSMLLVSSVLREECIGDVYMLLHLGSIQKLQGLTVFSLKRTQIYQAFMACILLKLSCFFIQALKFSALLCFSMLV